MSETDKMEQVFDYIKKLYLEGDLCMRELLATTKANEIFWVDLTIEEAAELYNEAVKWAGED